MHLIGIIPQKWQPIAGPPAKAGPGSKVKALNVATLLYITTQTALAKRRGARSAGWPNIAESSLHLIRRSSGFKQCADMAGNIFQAEVLIADAGRIFARG